MLARALALASAGAAQRLGERRSLDLAACARCATRIGEASHPGPAAKRAGQTEALAKRRAAARRARPVPLLKVQLVEPATAQHQCLA
eukprot:1608508-Lingulodinium_polyedra.AAC.1